MHGGPGYGTATVNVDILQYSYSGFEVTCPDCDLQSALDHAARDK